MAFSKAILLILSALLISTVSCNHENHDHHDHNNSNQHKGLLWLTILNSLGVTVENKADEISVTEANSDRTQSFKEHYTPKTTLDVEATEESNTPVLQNGNTFEEAKENLKLGLGFLISIPIVSLLVLFFFCYCICKCCGLCCEGEEKPGAVIIQSNTVQPAPAPVPPTQIIVHQAPPTYEMQPNWGPAPSNWAPQPMGQQLQYSPTSAYNPNFNPTYASAPPQYNNARY